MLVLARTPGKTITVRVGDQELTITYIDRRGEQIRLGFEGPRCFEVARDDAKNKVPNTQYLISDIQEMKR